jgi:hypothetical protein
LSAIQKAKTLKNFHTYFQGKSRFYFSLGGESLLRRSATACGA